MSIQASAVPIVPLGPLACATVLWRDRGVLHVTAIAKATFAFVHDGPMLRVDPVPIHDVEVHYHNNPVFSVVATSDLAPYRPFADVILKGHAYAPPDERAASVSLRLQVVRGEVLLDKSLQAVADHTRDGIVPFQRMPIVYERAFGGIGNQDNPIGVGAGSDTRKPNIVDPQKPQCIAGFGPISATWPARKFMLTVEQRKALAEPIVDLHDKLQWAYFQSAPPDQRIGYLHGDETLILEGMHPVLPTVTTQLPSAHALARIHFGKDDGYPLHLHADTLYIDMDAQKCSVAWRGNIAVPTEDALKQMWIAAAVELSGESIAWPTQQPTRPPAQGAKVQPVSDGSTTEEAQTNVLPLKGAVGPQQTVVMAAVPQRDAGSSNEQTQVMDTKPVQPATLTDVGNNTITAVVDPGRIQRDALPFARDAATMDPATDQPPSAPIPGAPWDPRPAPHVPRLTPGLENTLTLAPPIQPVPPSLARERGVRGVRSDEPEGGPPAHFQNGGVTSDEPEIVPPEQMAPLPTEPLVVPAALDISIKPPDLSQPLPPQPALLKPLAEPEDVARLPLPPEPIMVRKPLVTWSSAPRSPTHTQPAVKKALYAKFGPKK